MYSRHVADVLEAAVYGSCIYIYLGVLVLTAVSLTDNGLKSSVKKSPVRLSRGPPSKIGNLPKSASSPPPERPSTAIDPLSHVCLISSEQHQHQQPQERQVCTIQRMMLMAP